MWLNYSASATARSTRDTAGCDPQRKLLPGEACAQGNRFSRKQREPSPNQECDDERRDGRGENRFQMLTSRAMFISADAATTPKYAKRPTRLRRKMRTHASTMVNDSAPRAGR